MPNGNRSKNLKSLAFKKRLYLLILWALLLITILSVVLIYTFNQNVDTATLAALLGLVITFIGLTFLKPRIQFTDMQYRYFKLLSEARPAISTTCLFDEVWLEKLRLKKYKLIRDDSDATILMRIIDQPYKGKFLTPKRQAMEIINILKKPQLDLYAKSLSDYFYELWQKNGGGRKLDKQFILQFKKIEKLSPKTREDLNRVVAISERNSALITINVGYIPSLKKVYFLHADRYFPNQGYKYAVELIKELTQ